MTPQFKIVQITGIEMIHRLADGAFIPVDSDNKDFIEFKEKFQECGLEVVEGETVITPDYKELRRQAYPSLEEQMDIFFHKGGDHWKKIIKAIKDEYPKTIIEKEDIQSLPKWCQDLIEETDET